jgi:hypothetical protein
VPQELVELADLKLELMERQQMVLMGQMETQELMG